MKEWTAKSRWVATDGESSTEGCDEGTLFKFIKVYIGYNYVLYKEQKHLNKGGDKG